jgi:threonine/homoserine/homoserine lactone efflux protein
MKGSMMGTAIGSMLGFAAGVAVSPLPIVAMILLLSTPNGRRSGSLFGLGWVVGLTVLSTVVIAISDPAGASTDTGPATWTGWLKVVLGVLLLAFAAKEWRSRPPGDEEPPAPKWMASIDTMAPAKAFGLGVLLSAANPKNALLTIAAGAAIAATGASTSAEVVAVVVFVIVASLGVFAPLVIYLATGEQAVHTLESWRHWFIVNNTAIMAVLFFVIGLKLIGDGITVLS